MRYEADVENQRTFSGEIIEKIKDEWEKTELSDFNRDSVAGLKKKKPNGQSRTPVPGAL